MKYFVLPFIFMGAFVLFFSGCTASQETSEEEKKEEEIYVFDQVPEPTNPPEVITPAPDIPYYIVQIGAFTTKEKADTFAGESRQLISYPVEVKFSNSVNLYVVQIKQYYKTRGEAENVRNKLWQTDGYQDAWIITVQ